VQNKPTYFLMKYTRRSKNAGCGMKMYLAEILDALIETARRRIRAGEVTERALARSCGVSQPHLHNALKRVRSLSTDSADRLMRALNLTAEDLLWAALDGGSTRIRSVPLARNRIGPGYGAELTATRGAMPFPSSLVDPLVGPVAARLAPDLVMHRLLAANDVVLLDQNAAIRTEIKGNGPWVVESSGGLLVRYLRKGGTLLYIANEATLDDAARWQAISLVRHNILDVVRARIVWFGREIQEEPSGSAEPAGGSD
jgi:hypothetical protein